MAHVTTSDRLSDLMSDRDPSRPVLSVVVPTHDTRSLTLACLASVHRAVASGGWSREETEVVLLDDASSDGTAQSVRRRFPEVRILRKEHARGFTRAANQGLAACRGDILLLLNSDTEITSTALTALRSEFEDRESLGVAGAALHYPDGTPQWSGGPEPGPLWLFALASGLPGLLGKLPGVRNLRPVRGAGGRRVDWVSGAAMALRRQVWEEVGPFDTRFRLYCQDLDLCSRAQRAGWQIAVVTGCHVMHHHGSTIARQHGAAGRQNPELLWTELVSWACKRGGAPAARSAARVLWLGGCLRLAARQLARPFVPAAQRPAFRRASDSYRSATRAVRRRMRPR